MGKLKTIWKKAERFTIYISLGAFILSIIMMRLLPSIIPSHLPLLLLSISVVSAMHYLIREVEEFSRKAGTTFFNAHYPVAFQEFIRPYETISHLSITAFTSTLYYHSIESNPTKIKHLRLLLFVADDPCVMCSHIHFNLKDMILQWSSLKNRGQIEELEIKRIKAHSNIYFSIAESQRAMVGLLWPDSSFKNITVKEAIVISKESNPEAIIHLEKWFESMWTQEDAIKVYPSEATSCTSPEIVDTPKD